MIKSLYQTAIPNLVYIPQELRCTLLEELWKHGKQKKNVVQEFSLERAMKEVREG